MSKTNHLQIITFGLQRTAGCQELTSPKFSQGIAICIAPEMVTESASRKRTARRMYPRPQWGLGALTGFGVLFMTASG